MSEQLEMNLQGSARLGRRDARGSLGRLGARTVYWAPLWLPLVLVLQILLLGLRPALAESRRLDQAELEVSAREEALSSERRALERDLRKLGDPIWRERVRRSRRDLQRTPLTLAGSSSDS